MTINAQNRQSSTVRKPARRRADTTRQAILIAAARLFAEKGYSECNLREIADKVGIKAGSFYYHFKSKDQILDEVLDSSLVLITTAVETAVADLGPDASPLAKISSAMRAHITTFLAGDAEATALTRVYEHLPPSMKRRSRTGRKAYAEIWYGLFKEGIDKGVVRDDLDTGTTVSLILAGMSRIMEWYNPRTMTLDGVCALVVDLYLGGGLAVRPSGKPGAVEGLGAPK